MKVRTEEHNGEPCLTCMVRNHAICSPLSNAGREKLYKIQGRCNLNAGDVLFEEGSRRDFVYTLTSGMLRLLKTLPDGRRYITGFVLPGDFVGLIDDDHHILTAEAIHDSDLCIYSSDSLFALTKSDPAMREYFLQRTRIALRRAYDTQLILGRLSPIEKLARFILELKTRLIENQVSASPVPLSMNRTDIADHLGLTVETVSRSFSKLKKQGVIRLPATNAVEICDNSKLMTIAGFSEFECDKMLERMNLT